MKQSKMKQKNKKVGFLICYGENLLGNMLTCRTVIHAHEGTTQGVIYTSERIIQQH